MRHILDSTTYNGYTLSTSTKNNQGFYIEILEKIESILTSMTTQHARVFFTMFVLKYPSGSINQYPNNNALFSRFIEALTLHCKRRNYAPQYFWVREQSTTGQTHYHLMLLLDSNLIQNAHGLLDYATQLWGRCLGITDGQGLVHLCTSQMNNITQYGGIKIKRNDPNFQQIWANCFQIASYLAKCYSKGEGPANINEFGSSQLL